MNATALIKVEEGQIVAGTEFSLALTELSRLATSLEPVHDKSTCESALEVVAKGKADIKAITAAAEPERLRLQAALQELRSQRDKIINQIQEVIEPWDKAAREWNIGEDEAADAEEAKLNKGKKPEDRVIVKPDRPVVPGVRMQINYKFEVIDAKKVRPQWKCPDLVEIGKKVRADKDCDRSAKEIGGIRVWKE